MKIELVVLVEELERAGAAVADAAARIDAAIADARQRARVDAGRRRFLDDLLVAALHRAVALAEPHGVLVLVREHLDLDVARVGEELLHVEHRIAERRLRLERVSVTAGASAASVWTTRMPRPPPPPAALMITG